MRTGTYVYCLIGARRRPRVGRSARGLPGAGGVRLIAVPHEDHPNAQPRMKTWLAVADAPLDRYGEEAINRRLADLEWVARAAVAHEAVVESFAAQPALLPMKLFTIFMGDDRAVAHVRRDRERVDRLLARVAGRQEWGVRVMMDRSRVSEAARLRKAAGASRTAARGGTSYLERKKADRDLATELARDASRVVTTLFKTLERGAVSATRRSTADLPGTDRRLLLDAAFLVPRAEASRFRARVKREAKALQPRGYVVSLTGPWPPYSFAQD